MIKAWIGIFCLTFIWILDRSQDLGNLDNTIMVEEIQSKIQAQKECSDFNSEHNKSYVETEYTGKPPNTELHP